MGSSQSQTQNDVVHNLFNLFMSDVHFIYSTMECRGKKSIQEGTKLFVQKSL